MKKKSLNLGLMLIMLLAMGTSLIAVDYEVIGAGTAAANGTYIQQGGVVNNKPWYQKADGYVISASGLGGMLWSIDTDASGITTNYSATDIDGTPPLTGWSVYPPGIAPAPTLSIVGEDPPLTVTYTLQSSGFSGLDAGGDSAPTFTDIDGDGLLDLISGETGGTLLHYEQNGVNSLLFTLVPDTFSGIDVGGYSTPTFTDLDGDGLLDLLCGNLLGTIYHYEQSSSGSAIFTERSTSFVGADIGSYTSPTFTDLDGNGLLDMLTGKGSERYLSHYQQAAENSTTFSLVTDNFNGYHTSSKTFPTFTDLNGDGLLDLLIGRYEGTIMHLDQDATNSTSFSFVVLNWQGINLVGNAVMAFQDIDGDGYTDLLVGQSNGEFAHYESDYLSGSVILDAPENVTISHDGTDVTVNWDAVDGASTYNIYSDADPYGTFSTLVGVEINPSTTWIGAAADAKMFYRITAE